MAKGFDTLHVKSAVKDRSKIDLSFDHLTTMDFGQIVPLAKIRTIPGDKFNVKGNYFSRLAPLVLPTYGKFSFRTVNGYVPIHQLAYDGEAWISGNTTFEGATPLGRFITLGDLFNFIYYYCFSTTAGTASNCDFCYVESNGTVRYKLFSNVGRYYVKILNALGYSLPQGVDLAVSSYWSTVISIKKLSAFPLLAFFKLYNDYMSQSTRYNFSALSSFLRCVKYRYSATGFNPTTCVLDRVGLATLFQNLYLNYDNDYFTSAWENPNEPLGSVPFVNQIKIPGLQSGGYIDMAVDDNYINDPVSFAGDLISHRALQMLQSFDNWVRRNNYSGSRAVQQIYSRMGIKTDDYKSHYAHILSTDVMPVQVGDVTSTADTTSGKLGEYAGKGIMSGSKGFSVDSSDYGYVISLGYFTVVPMNPYGFDRDVLTVEPLEFYTPEFDGIGADAISVMEYFENPTVDPTSDTTHGDDVYGFTERYNSYRFGRDLITGDMRKFNSNPMNAWHTGRDMTAIRQANSLVAQSTSVNTLPQVDSEYDRMFNTTTSNEDHFYLTAHFEVDSLRPMKNLNSVVNLGEGDTVVPRNGNVIS